MLLLVDMKDTKLQWTKRNPVGKDPFFVATIGEYNLDVRVAAECFWEWSIDHDDEGEVARGTICVDVDEDEWDYQDVDVAQARCENVARALLLARAREAWGEPFINVCTVDDGEALDDDDIKWSVCAPEIGLLVDFFDSEGEALVAAVEAAPPREEIQA